MPRRPVLARRPPSSLAAPLLALAMLLPTAVGAQNVRSGRGGPPLDVPRAVRRDIPLGPEIRRAYAAGTRDSSGAPGARYWQQSVDYAIDATLDPDSAILRGRETITLHNTSPDTLTSIVVRLLQNYFTATVPRNDYVTDITPGMVVERLTVNGTAIPLGDPHRWQVDGTIARVVPDAPVLPGADATLEVGWWFRVPDVPRTARGERMGRWGHELYQIAQWYPQVAMYDDLRGWDTDPYLGKGEFYDQFGKYDVRITLPAGWIVGATGTLANPDEVLSATTRQRLALAMQSDTTVHVVTSAERGAGSATAGGQTLTWHFTAPRVNDVAFAASKDFVWDATRAMTPDPTLVQVFYLPEHAAYQQTAQYARFALEHHARYIMPYAFPQASVADGPETGMEYPMIIFDGPGFGVTTHELGHQWFPMMVGSNETWYGWQDEGFNEYIDEAAGVDFTHQPVNRLRFGSGYRQVAGSELEAPLMWHSDWAGPFYEVQAYEKAPVALWALGGAVGSDSAVHAAFAAYAKAWQWKHPSPWDFFMFMDRSLKQDLGWFWDAWWFTTRTFDQGIASVQARDGTLTARVTDHGEMAMPIILRVDYADGSAQTFTTPVSVWLGGARAATVRERIARKPIARVTLDPDNRFQDLNRSDNVWEPKP